VGFGIAPSDVDSIGKALNIASSTGGAIYLQDTDSPTGKFAAISYNGATAELQIHAHHSASYIDLGTNGTPRLRITSGGSVNIGDDFTQTTYKTQIETTNQNVLRLVTDSDDANGVELVLRKDSASPADEDNIGNIYFQGNDDAGNDTFYASMEAYSSDVSNNSEDGYIRFRTRNNGSMGERLRIDSSGFIKQTFSSHNSTVAEGLFINNKDNSTGINASLIFSCDSGERKKASISYIDTGAYGTGDMVFSLDNDADSGSLHVTNHERMRITKDGRVLIGQTSSTSSSKLCVHGAISTPEAFFELNRTDDPANGQNIGVIEFSQGSAASRLAARLMTRRDGGVWGAASLPTRFEFHTCVSGSNSASEKVRITSSGQLQINHGNAAKMSFYHDAAGSLNHITSNNGNEIKVSSGNGDSNGIEFWDYTGVNKRCQIDGHGIKFGTDTSDANALNDYEEGAVNLTLVGQYGGSISYSYRVGRYIKIGGLVHLTGDIRLSGSWSGNSGNVYIQLPFQSFTNGGTVGNGIVAEWNLNNSNWDSLMLQLDNNAANARITSHSGSNNNTSHLQTGELGNGRYLKFGITYHTHL